MTRLHLLLACSVAVLGGCSRESQPAPAATVAAAQRATTAIDSLDRLDPRAPVPLLPIMAHHQKQNMRDHLVAVQEIIAALATSDFEGAEKAAGRIGSSEQMGRMCTHMGAAAPGFTEQALEFHRTADRIAVAARAHDAERALSEVAATLQTCTSCHALWKQQVVDEATWKGLTRLDSPRDSGQRGGEGK